MTISKLRILLRVEQSSLPKVFFVHVSESVNVCETEKVGRFPVLLNFAPLSVLFICFHII
jgi:hypothetical protein